MCSGASTTMIVAYYNKLDYNKERTLKLNGENINQDLREYVWQDKGENLQHSCYIKNTNFKVDGSFAVTSDQGCDLGRKYNWYFNKYGLETEMLKDDDDNVKYNYIKEAINRNHLVLFGEPGHIMVAIGYLDIPENEKTEIKVDIEISEGINKGDISHQATVKKDFLLIVHDPKRNRNRSQENGGYFAADGNNSTYLVVYDPIKKEEYLCRSGRNNNIIGYKHDKDYLCIKPGETALEVFPK